MGVWIAFGTLCIAGIVQVVAFAFFLGRLFETVNALKRRMDQQEGRPIVNHDAKLSSIEITLSFIQKSLDESKKEVERRFEELEGAIRNMWQVSDSAKRTRGRTNSDA